MIAEQTTMNTSTQTSLADGWPAPIDGTRAAAMGTLFARMGRAIKAWARVPALPYAAMWEASVVLELMDDQKFYEPDPVASESPFLTDLWLRR